MRRPVEAIPATLSRRAFLGGVGASLMGCVARTPLAKTPNRPLVEMEGSIGGRLGVYAVATDSGAIIANRSGERFALCSTFKWALAAAVLSRVDRGELRLSEEIAFGAQDLLEYAPVARANLARGRMNLSELTEAAVTMSDNTAANLLLDRVGGPTGLTRFLRAHGDSTTRLDRNEPMLNLNLPLDPRDTTTPEAMVGTLRALLLTSALSPTSRALLLGWMVACHTGADRIRAGLPATWRVGHKTGTGERGAVNDVAIAWPPDRGPILVAIYLSDSTAPLTRLTAAHAEIARVIASRLGGS